MDLRTQNSFNCLKNSSSQLWTDSWSVRDVVWVSHSS